MKFSIIVPVYNVEKYLKVCLDSILKQDYTDYEIIAVNDGSTDGSLEILNEYKKKTERLVILSQNNKGLGGARNTGIDHAQGEYLIFLDSDDYIDKSMLNDTGRILTQYNLDILAFDGYRVTEDGKVIDTITVNSYRNEYTNLTRKQFLVLEPTGCTKIYKRKLFTDIDIRFPEKLWYEDLATTYKLVLAANNLGYLKKPMYYYLQQADSITHSTNVTRMMEIMSAFDEEIIYYKDQGVFNEYFEELEWNCFLHVLYYSAFRLFSCGYHIKEMKELYSYAKAYFPHIEDNKYVRIISRQRDLMDLILEKKYFRFYLKTGFSIKCYELIKRFKRLFGEDKKEHYDKTKNS